VCVALVTQREKTDVRTDMTMIIAFRNFANSPDNSCKTIAVVMEGISVVFCKLCAVGVKDKVRRMKENELEISFIGANVCVPCLN
jgi:hypothetical protein